MDEQYKEQVSDIVKFITEPIIGESDVEFIKEGDQWRVNIITNKAKRIVGGKGEVLSSLQHLLRVIIHKKLPEDRTHFLVDVNLFRQRREEFINEKVPEIAEINVLKNGESVIMTSLSSYERKIIHGMLAEVDGLETTSVGERYNRRLIIRPTSDAGSLGMERSKVIDIAKEVSEDK